MVFDIAAGLNSPESSARIGAARFIRQNMETAADFDVVGKLLQMCKDFSNSSERWEYVFTALGFNDERTTELAKNTFTKETDSKFMVMAARRLSFLSESEKLTFIAPILFADSNRNRTRLCANLLAGNSLLDAKTAIRISVIADRKCSLPPFTRETAEAWISEMQGAYPASVRAQFLKLADKPVDLFLTFWERFSDAQKVWTLDTLIKDSPAGYEILVYSVLRSEKSADLLIAALGCIKNISDSESASKLLSHGNEKVRALAVLCVNDTDRLKELLSDGAQTVRANVVKKLSESKENIPLIASCFSDKGWMVRAAAVQAMAGLAPDSVETVKDIFLNGNADAKTAAAKCLAGLDLIDWVEETVS